MTDTADLLRRLASTEPWSWSREGLDDRCLHCGCDERAFSGDIHRWHYSDCVWVEARRALDMDLGRHGVLDRARPGPEDYDDVPDDFDWSTPLWPRSMHQLLPRIRAPRGGITYPKPPDIPT